LGKAGMSGRSLVAGADSSRSFSEVG